MYSMFYLKDVETHEKFWIIEMSAKEAAKKARKICRNNHTYQVMVPMSQNIPGYRVIGNF